jgi:hypothetical protein
MIIIVLQWMTILLAYVVGLPLLGLAYIAGWIADKSGWN